MRRLLLLTSAVVFFDTLFFAALTPLLPHYVHELHMGKTGAGVLAAAYPAGAFVGAAPSAVIAARAGLKRSVVIGLVLVAACTAAFGLSDRAWELDAARFVQGLASAFTWTGALGWLVSAAPPGRRGQLIGQAFAAAVAGGLFGPVVGGIASVAGISATFVAVALLSLGLVAWTARTESAPPVRPQPVRVLLDALRDPRIAGGFWLVVLPALLFGTLSVLAPLRLSALGFGAVAIGGVFLCSAFVEAVNNLLLGRVSDRHGTLAPLAAGALGSSLVALALPWPGHRFVLAALVVCGGLAFGAFFTPAMALLTELGDRRGLGHSYSSALINLAWAPGQTLGAAGGGAVAQATSDATAYLVLAAVCALTLAALWRSRGSTAWTTRSVPASSAPSSHTTGAA
jgi:predicted MFS family arabinose efflux permease